MTTKADLIKIIKQYESKTGYRICNICNRIIIKGKRIVISKEDINPYSLHIIGAVCENCYNSLLKRQYAKPRLIEEK